MARQTKGRLYKSGKKGAYHLQYYVKGKEFRVTLKDVAGNIITKESAARIAADKILLPLAAKDEAERLRLIANELSAAEAKAETAEKELQNSKATIEKGWDLYMTCSSRLKSCKRYPADAIPKMSMADIYRTYYKHFAEWMKEKNPEIFLLSEITADHAAGFAADLQKKLASGTYNKYRFFLTALFDTLMTDEKITIARNPFKSMERMDDESNSRRELSIAELQTIIERAEGDLKLLLQVGTFTGLRLGDCCTLQWNEIDMAAQVIRRKPRKTARKTKAVVTLGIPRILWHALNMIPESDRLGYLLPQYAEIYLAPRGPNKMTRIIQKHFRMCGIEVHAQGTGMKYHYEGKKKVYDKSTRAVVEVGFHSLRHTWVSLHAMHGTPQAVIQESAGHANPAMTEHYTHVSIDAARRAAEALNLPQLADGDIIDVTPEGEPERAALRQLADTLPIEQVREILSQTQSRAHALRI